MKRLDIVKLKHKKYPYKENDITIQLLCSGRVKIIKGFGCGNCLNVEQLSQYEVVND